MKRLAAFVVGAMVSCAPIPDAPATRAVPLTQTLPPMKAFQASAAPAPRRSNAEIARDFLDLSFRMESGRAIPRFTRFEGPITVGIAGNAPVTLQRDLDALIARLRREAGIDISRTDAADAQIIVEAVPQAVLQRAVPRAACFVVPRISRWADYQVARHSAQLDWTTLTRRDRAAIFVPADDAPQEIRDCLHEELAQALGPLNDLYRLPDSVFNDDNIHAVLTGFDMLILRATYAPELASGMSEAEVAARLPHLLARLNPAGQMIRPPRQYGETSRDWIGAIEAALTAGSSPGNRRNSAQQAIRLGQQFGWDGPRAGFAQYAFGRLQVGNDPSVALAAFQAADKAYASGPQMRIHSAHVAVQRSAFALAAGDGQLVLDITDQAIPVAQAHENAELLSTLMMFKAEALAMMGNVDAAEVLRLDSLGWARYGFGTDARVQARLSEVAALRPY